MNVQVSKNNEEIIIFQYHHYHRKKSSHSTEKDMFFKIMRKEKFRGLSFVDIEPNSETPNLDILISVIFTLGCQTKNHPIKLFLIYNGLKFGTTNVNFVCNEFKADCNAASFSSLTHNYLMKFAVVLDLDF